MKNLFVIYLCLFIITFNGCAGANTIVLYKHNQRLNDLEELHKNDLQKLKKDRKTNGENLQTEKEVVPDM